MDKKIEELLQQIKEKTKNSRMIGLSIGDILLAYAREDWFKEDYHGGFWSNEGANWEYSWNKEIVKLIDEFFIQYRTIYFPKIKHKNYNNEYKTRTEFLNDLPDEPFRQIVEDSEKENIKSYEVKSFNYNSLPNEIKNNWLLPNNGRGREYASYIVEYINGKVSDVHSDAIEPEDASFGRDLNWIKSALENAYQLGLKERK